TRFSSSADGRIRCWSTMPSGKPILMEKPIERTLDAAQAIVGTCAQAGVPLGIVLQHRMRPSALELKRVLEADELGEIASVEITVPWWRPQSYYDEPGRGTFARDGGGVLISQAIHTIDLALYLTGPVRRVQAMLRTSALHQMETEDFAVIGLDFASRAVGSIVATTAAYPGGPESIALHGTKGSARLAANELVICLRNGDERTFGEAGGSGGGADPMAFTHDWHRAIIADFADAIEQNRPPVASGQDALAVHRLIDAAVRSSREGWAVDVKGAT
ncbi:MAG: Gfo/Idh/MocA family oxidoreductase, partial [Pseudomonadota bacterium]